MNSNDSELWTPRHVQVGLKFLLAVLGTLVLATDGLEILENWQVFSLGEELGEGLCLIDTVLRDLWLKCWAHLLSLLVVNAGKKLVHD